MTALYAYAIVAGSVDPASAPAGIDSGAIEIERATDIGVLISPIDDAAYDPDTVGAMSRNVEWLGERAAAHDRVVTWAVDHGTTIPLPIFSLFRDRASVRAMLAARGADLRRTLADLGDAREYTVRIFRIDTELAAVLGAQSPVIAQLEARAAQATPGQRYLLDRKLEEAQRTELDRVGRETADAVCAALAAIARQAARDAVTPRPGANGQAVLNASFLVSAERVDAFRSAMTRLMTAHGTQGFRLEFTGPWAPYHFVGSPSDAVSAASSTAVAESES